MLGLRSKILLGFSGLLVILLAVSLLGSELLRRYSDAAQQMLRDDLNGVVAAQQMDTALDALEAPLRGGAVSGAGGAREPARDAIAQFEEGLVLQKRGSNSEEERDATSQLEAQWADYRGGYERLLALSAGDAARAAVSESLRPPAEQIRTLTHRIERLNVASMKAGHAAARAAARTARLAVAPQLDVSAMAAARLAELGGADARDAAAGAGGGGAAGAVPHAGTHADARRLAPRGFESLVRVTDDDSERSFPPKPVAIRDR